MRQNKLFYILIVVYIFILAGTKNTFGQSEETSFNVITYNIRQNTSYDGENAWPHRKDKVEGLLKFHKADIFAIQEALSDQMDDLINFFVDFGHVGVGRDDGKRSGEHMAIFYNEKRFSKIDDGTFWLSETPDRPGLGWDAACNRTCTWIQLKDKLNGKKFFIFNTHLDHIGTKAREEGVSLILDYIKMINNDNLPLIFCGDFNLEKNSAPVQTILKVLDDAKDQSSSKPYGPEGTFTGFAVKAEILTTIDFIFINKKIKVVRHGVLTDSFNLFYPSDHLPVLAEILLN